MEDKGAHPRSPTNETGPEPVEDLPAEAIANADKEAWKRRSLPVETGKPPSNAES
jgi:hypothetical protein